MEKFKSHFTKAINDNKNNTGTLKAVGIANAVKEQVDPNKENQRILAQASVEANEKIDQLEKQTAQLFAALMAKKPQQQQPLQDTNAATIKALTDKINRLECGSGGRGSGGRGHTEGTYHLEATTSLEIMMVVLEQQGDGTMTTTVGHVDMI